MNNVDAGTEAAARAREAPTCNEFVRCDAHPHAVTGDCRNCQRCTLAKGHSRHVLCAASPPIREPGLREAPAELKRTYLNDSEFHPVTCVQCGHVGGLKVTLSDLLIEMMEREERNGFDRGWAGAVSFFVDGNQGLLPAVEPEEMRRRAKLTRDTADADARKLEIDLGATSPTVAPVMPPGCTGLVASWCPVCGDCSCPQDEDGGRIAFEDAGCRLHGPKSKHAEQEAIPSKCGSSPPYDCPGCGAMTCIHIDDRGRLEPRAAAPVEPPKETTP